MKHLYFFIIFSMASVSAQTNNLPSFPWYYSPSVAAIDRIIFGGHAAQQCNFSGSSSQVVQKKSTITQLFAPSFVKWICERHDDDAQVLQRLFDLVATKPLPVNYQIESLFTTSELYWILYGKKAGTFLNVNKKLLIESIAAVYHVNLYKMFEFNPVALREHTKSFLAALGVMALKGRYFWQEAYD